MRTIFQSIFEVFMYGFWMIILICLLSCESIDKKFGIPQDNPAEEVVEEVIKQKTGLDIDLTPTSPEEND